MMSCCSRHASRYFFFFSFLPVSRTFLGSLLHCDLASVSVTCTSTMQLVPRSQMPQRRRLPCSLTQSSDLESLVHLVGQAVVFSATRPVRIRGLSHIAEGVIAFPAMCMSLSRILLWREITKTPFFQKRRARLLWTCWYAVPSSLHDDGSSLVLHTST
jgi:hypothetical protein